MRKQTQSIMTLMPHIGLLTDFSILNSILWSQNLTGLIVCLRVRLTHSLFLLGWWQFGIKDLNRFIVVVLYFVIISTMFMQGHFYSFLVKRTLWFGKKLAIVRKNISVPCFLFQALSRIFQTKYGHLMKQAWLYASKHQKTSSCPAWFFCTAANDRTEDLIHFHQGFSHQMKQIYSSVHLAKILCLKWGKFHHVARIDLGKFVWAW